MTSPAHLLTLRIQENRERVNVLVRQLATHPAIKLDIQCAVDDLDEAARWVGREELNAWAELARSVSATIDFAEWRLRDIERTVFATQSSYESRVAD